MAASRCPTTAEHCHPNDSWWSPLADRCLGLGRYHFHQAGPSRPLLCAQLAHCPPNGSIRSRSIDCRSTLVRNRLHPAGLAEHLEGQVQEVPGRVVEHYHQLSWRKDLTRLRYQCETRSTRGHKATGATSLPNRPAHHAVLFFLLVPRCLRSPCGQGDQESGPRGVTEPLPNHMMPYSKGNMPLVIKLPSSFTLVLYLLCLLLIRAPSRPSARGRSNFSPTSFHHSVGF